LAKKIGQGENSREIRKIFLRWRQIKGVSPNFGQGFF